jgi:hypothetical protein
LGGDEEEESYMSDKKTVVVGDPAELLSVATRRSFLRMMGVGGSIVLLPTLFAACDDDDEDDDTGTNPGGNGVTLNLTTDTGILNYAYALEQLEAAFYTAVLAAPAFAGFSANEKEVLQDLQQHEVAHREFFKSVLGDARIADLALETTAVNAALASQDSILRAAETFEDLGVAAYNGAGKYIASADNLLLAGKIVSVEARHAAAIRDIRDIRNGNTGRRFAGADVVNAQGLDVKAEPGAVLSRADAFVATTVTITAPTRTPATADQLPPTNI